jgi:Transposase zinc-ribbon domain
MTKRQHERGEPAPGTLPWIQLQFPDEAACVRYLTAKRWPDGFRCPCCSARKAWELKIRPGMFECASCGRQTSVTAGTVMHGSKVPLQLWFWAAHLMATHSNGISAMQLYRQLGLGSYKTAWLLCSKLRRAMAFRDRTELVGLVEVDEAVLPFRTKNDPPTSGRGRDLRGKIAVIAGVEVVPSKKHRHAPGRVRLKAIGNFEHQTLERFVEANVGNGPRSSPTVCPATMGCRRWVSRIVRSRSGLWRRTSCCLGCIACSPFSSAGVSAPTMVFVASTSSATSRSSFIASIAGAIEGLPSLGCSA